MTESHARTDLSTVVSGGDRYRSLLAMRDRLAAEADDSRWAQHKRECVCTCGIGDGRTLVALLKQLHVVLDAIEATPSGEETSAVVQLSARLAAVRSQARGEDSAAS